MNSLLMFLSITAANKSSANNNLSILLLGILVILVMSLINIENKIGERFVPWPKPAFIS